MINDKEYCKELERIGKPQAIMIYKKEIELLEFNINNDKRRLEFFNKRLKQINGRDKND